MSRSEIFDSFVKIAQQKGLISDDKPTNERVEAEHTEKDFHETNPRHDSLSIEQISKLYKNKPQMPKDMEYKNNIMEVAHPDMAVLFPAHDKLNGLIENEMEGQNIRIHISLKEPDGHLIQRKYAENLVLSLVRVANDLDNRNQEELRKLADVCLVQAAGFKKQALWPLVLGIAAAVGALYVQQHMNFHSDGFNADYQKAIGEIDDLLTSNSNLGVGVSYTPEFTQEMNKLKGDLGQVFNAVQKALPIIQSVEKPRTGSEKVKEMARIAQDPKTKEATQAIEEFKNVIKEYGPEVATVISNFQRQSYKDEVTASKGALTKLVDWTEILHGGGGLVSDDFDDVKRALVTLWKDIQGLQTALMQAQKIEQTIIQQAPQGPPTDTTTEAPTPTPEEGGKEEGGGLSGLEEGAEGLFSSLIGK